MHGKWTTISILKRLSLVSRLFPTGPVAAYIQGLLVVVITSAFLLAAQLGISDAEPASTRGSNILIADWMEAHLITLRYFYLFAAICLILACRSLFERPAAFIRHEISQINPITPKRELIAVYSQVVLATVCFGIETLQQPPHIISLVIENLGPAWIVTAIWSGALSVATAAFGANAVAAGRAL